MLHQVLIGALRVLLGSALLYLSGLGCGRGSSVSVDIVVGDGSPSAPADPPYTQSVTFPSGHRLALVTDSGLTGTYPSPGRNPFGSRRQVHYARVGYFIDLSRASLSARVSENFTIGEYLNPTVRRGGRRAYVDAQIVYHLQQVRSGLGRPLVVSSAFRDPEHNRDVGGATYSRHLYGDAVDIDVDQSAPDANARAQEIYNEARDVGIDYVQPLTETSVSVGGSQRASWVHVDDRGF